MANGQIGLVIRHLRSFLGAQDSRASTDGELLKRFADSDDQQAFAALVERYAPLVFGVCRRTLQDEHAAEDAFQATFLVLYKKAHSLDGRGSIANWLYTVAYHLALKAKIRGDQRRAHERQVPAMPDAETKTEPVWSELRPLLDEELERLPAKYRTPMVLCYLSGKTNEQAAEELGWTKDTVRGRLAKGREILRGRLARRGITLSALSLGALLTENVAGAAVPIGWIDGTLKAAGLLSAGAASGISSSVLALANSFLRDVFLVKIKLAAAFCLMVGIVATGVGIAHHAHWDAPSSHVNGKSGQTNPFVVGAEYDPSKPYVVEPVANCPEDMQKEEMEDSLGEPMNEMLETPPESELEPAQLPKLLVKRRNWACEEELRKQLLLFSELRLDGDPRERPMTHLLVERAQEATPGHETAFTPNLLGGRPDLAGLPYRKGATCQLPKDKATDLQNLSREMRSVLAEMLTPRGGWDPVEPHLLAATLRKNFLSKTKIFTTVDEQRSFREVFRKESSVATLMQMLPADENKDIRLVLVEQLAAIRHPSSSQALARLALFDVAPEVRTEAIQALSLRPRDDYREVLLSGFRYPWTPVADHAAEALVTLDDRGAIPGLRQLTSEPDPALPFRDPEQGNALVVREVVRINHFRNCVMCHAASTSTDDLVRGPVPDPARPLPPLFTYYGSMPGGDLVVRADITYLRQDFSVAQPVEKSAPWPKMQRFDYLVRNRPLDPAETARRSRPEPIDYPQREAVLYALRELSGK